MQKYQMGSETSEDVKTRINQIKDRITELVERHFSADEKIVYLSRLGNELGVDRLTLEHLTGNKLSQYLRENFPYQIGATGQHQNILFLAPADADVTSFATVLTNPQRSVMNQESAATTFPRYISRFWAAFAKPLQPGETQRFINLSTLVFGPDATALQTKEGDDIRLIKVGDIAPQGASGSAADTAERIAQWLASERLDGRNYMAGSKRPTTKRESLLAAIIDTLTTEQLKRVVLPLDIIKALSQHKV